MVGASMDVVNPTTGEIQTSQKLAQTYAELLQTRSIREAVQATLDLPDLPDVSVTLLRDTQLLRITVADTVPERAAAAADELARQLIRESPSAPERQEQAYRAFVQSQLVELEDEIEALSRAVVSARESGDRETVARLQEELSLRRANYSGLLSYIKGTSTNQVRLFEEARVPRNPTAPKVMQNTVLAAIVALMLAAGAAFLIEHLDDSIKYPSEIQELLQLPTLGTIAEMSANGASPEQIVHDEPVSRFSEGYRMLWTNLRYTVPGNPSTVVFMITSVEPGAGKTTTSSNLAIVAADAGRKTILVDADMRRPDLHKIWHSPQEPGLSSLLVGEVESIDEVLRPTEVDRLQLLPSGRVPPNAAELLGSPQMIEVLQALSERAEVIVLDAPPVFAVADTRILGSLVTGTILVAEIGHTSIEAFAQAMEALKVGGTVLGAVLNRLDLKRPGHYYSYHYYGYYDHYYGYGASSDDGQGDRKGKRRKDKRKAVAQETDT